jgi:hypothetical protein
MRRSVIAALFAAGLFAAAEPALAIPAFARRYKVECHFCHDIYPKLNLIGQRFKERGFRMEREEAFDLATWARTIPVSARANANHFLDPDGEDSNTGFVKGISAGHLGQRVSYWVDDALLFSGGDDKVTHLKPSNAWGRVEILSSGKLYVKGGRIELDIPFTQVRTPHLFGYDIYFANTGRESDSIATHQDGVELGGELGQTSRWSAALVQRANRGDGVSGFANLYLRASKRIDRNRFGGFAFFGKSQLGNAGQDFANAFWRVGGDWDVWLSRLNLYGTYMYGRNDNSIPPTSPAAPEALSFHGGFLQADYRVVEPVALTLRFNFVNRPPGQTDLPKEWEASVFPGIQVWLLDDRLKVSLEYGFLNKGRSDFGALQAEVAF